MSARFGHLARDVDLLRAKRSNADIHLRTFNKLSQPFGDIRPDFWNRFAYHGDFADVGIEDGAIGMYPVTRFAGTAI
ncbi:hypothetical protein D3C73_1533990 [compost metagenome]